MKQSSISPTDRFDDLATGYFTDTLSGSEAAEFLRLLHSSETCAARYRELEASFARSFVPRFEEIRAENYRALAGRISPPRAKVSRLRTARLRRIALRIAAVAVLALTTLTSVYYIGRDVVSVRRAGDQITELTVPLGSQLRVLLPDKSVAWLNSGSVLRYDRNFGRRERRVELTGEAYFEVRHDEKHPFLVCSEELQVRVLGTTFDMRNYAEDATASLNLLEGSVSLTECRSGRNVVLKPDQCGTFDKASGTLTVQAADARKAAQWTVGKLCFVNTPLPELLRELERHYNVKISIDSERIAAERFSGSMSLSLPLDEILDYIDVDSKYVKTRQGEKIRLSDRQPISKP